MLSRASNLPTVDARAQLFHTPPKCRVKCLGNIRDFALWNVCRDTTQPLPIPRDTPVSPTPPHNSLQKRSSPLHFTTWRSLAAARQRPTANFCEQGARKTLLSIERARQKGGREEEEEEVVTDIEASAHPLLSARTTCQVAFLVMLHMFVIRGDLQASGSRLPIL